MNTRSGLAGICAIAAILLPALAFAAKSPPAPRITSSQAQAAALKKVPGKVVSTHYELEDGQWQYAILVQNGKGLYEVEVSAKTGKITDTEKTSMAEEREEAAADAAAANKAARHKSSR